LKYPKPIKNLVNDILLNCHNNNIGLVFVNKGSVRIGKDLVSGYFDANKIVVAIKNNQEDWLSTLVHESCHLDQYLERNRWYSNLMENKLDDWVNGAQLKNARTHVDKVIKLEHDCEKRSLRKIEKYKLPLDMDKSNKIARLHIYYYNWVYKNRVYLSKNVFSIEAINLVNLSKRFILSDLPIEIEKYYDTQC
jgi:hypothetical protein